MEMKFWNLIRISKDFQQSFLKIAIEDGMGRIELELWLSRIENSMRRWVSRT